MIPVSYTHLHELYVVVAETGSGIDKVYGAGMAQDDRRQLRVMAVSYTHLVTVPFL